MQVSANQAIIAIVAVIVVLLFLGIIFLVMVLYHSNRKVQLLKEQQSMKDLFEKQLLQAKLEIQDQTFNFISEEIHDNVGQVLSVAKVQLNIMDQQAQMDRSMLKDAKENISKAMNELREISISLSREQRQSFDLLEAISYEVKQLNNTRVVHASMSVEGSGRNIIEQHKRILFRLIQESMQNILKHANASEINISINLNDQKSFIMISDNGIGFDVERAYKQDNGMGLKNMLNRAHIIGGEVNIESALRIGTTVTISLPYCNA